MKEDTSIIISTYNSPLWLEKVLYGYNNQTYRWFEIIIADDGSSDTTKKLIDKMRKLVFYPITHVWHKDDGFQKTKILNAAILKCQTPYIIMSDGDCIPRKDFVEQHIKFREHGYFLSGGYFKLPMAISKAITPLDIYNEKCFKLNWLRKSGLGFSIKNWKLLASGFSAWLLNSITPTTPSWNGHNASGWKTDILAINGFDQRMHYGGEDRELGERLFNYGIKSKQIRYTAICVHLDHSRGYVNKEALDKNKAIREQTKVNKVTKTPYGIHS